MEKDEDGDLLLRIIHVKQLVERCHCQSYRAVRRERHVHLETVIRRGPFFQLTGPDMNLLYSAELELHLFVMLAANEKIQFVTHTMPHVELVLEVVLVYFLMQT